ncbi:NAD(P)-binding protein [Tricholoma matsutake]|nr:NAD(P)-binding protein [Tricholoma matsutake 945]
MASHAVAFVTGASQGIGRAIALRLARDGFNIAINDVAARKERLDVLSQEIAEKGQKTCVLVGDVSVEADVEGMINDVAGRMGRLDVMVANAGVIVTKPILETTVVDWDRIFSVNARGTFLCYKYAGRQMIKQGQGGRIVGASSIAGKQGEPFLSAYTSTKFAVRGLTQTAAREFGPHGITVNAYSPGPVDTPMVRSLGEALGDKKQFFEEENVNKVPLNYQGTPTDVASIVSYLASPESRFITGQSISVNGGRYFD